MKSSKNTPIMLISIAIVAMASMAGAVELASTGTNTVSGNAWAEGDTFATETHPYPFGDLSDQLYVGVWAHAYVPTGNHGINSAESQRTVPARTESRTYTIPVANGHTYDIKSNYSATTVIARASKMGALGLAESFSEVSSQSTIHDYPFGDSTGHVDGNSQLVAFATHSGTGTANASALGSADYSTMIKTGEFGVSGSVSGSASINAANNNGGAVTGTAWIGSGSDGEGAPSLAASYSFEYISLSSSRDGQNALSTIDGTVSGHTSASGFYALSSKGRFGNSESHTSGDLSATATTYMLGDSIIPGPYYSSIRYISTQLDSEAGDTAKTSLPIYDTLWGKNGPGYVASSYLLSSNEASVR